VAGTNVFVRRVSLNFIALLMRRKMKKLLLIMALVSFAQASVFAGQFYDSMSSVCSVISECASKTGIYAKLWGLVSIVVSSVVSASSEFTDMIPSLDIVKEVASDVVSGIFKSFGEKIDRMTKFLGEDEATDANQADKVEETSVSSSYDQDFSGVTIG